MIPHVFAPSPVLAPYVKCYWTLEGERENTPDANAIVPDGTVKLVFHHGDAYQQLVENGLNKSLPRSFLIGPLSKPFEVKPLGQTASFVVCFHPAGFSAFSPVPLHHAENLAVPLEDLFGEAGRQLEEEVLLATSSAARIGLAEGFLLRCMVSAKALDAPTRAAVDLILASRGQLSVQELSRLTHVHPKRLARRFAADVGLTPKQFSQTVRLQSVLRLLVQSETTGAHVSIYDAYFDQSHFIREVKRFTGVTPRALSGDRLRMSTVFDRLG